MSDMDGRRRALRQSAVPRMSLCAIHRASSTEALDRYNGHLSSRNRLLARGDRYRCSSTHTIKHVSHRRGPCTTTTCERSNLEVTSTQIVFSSARLSVRNLAMKEPINN